MVAAILILLQQPYSVSFSRSLVIFKEQFRSRNSQIPTKEKAANPELIDEKSRAMESIEKLQLPHNYEAILREANSPVDMASMDRLLYQLYAGVFLNRGRKKYWLDKKNRNCFMLYAKDLSICWGNDRRYWNWSCQKETSRLAKMQHGEFYSKIDFIVSHVSIDVAELLEVCWLDVKGQFDVAKLSPGTLYGVALIVMLKENAFGWGVPVNVGVTLPNGQNVQHKENLRTKPRGKWIEIPLGEFTTSFENSGQLNINFHETDTGSWKGGLLVKGVSFQPKN